MAPLSLSLACGDPSAPMQDGGSTTGSGPGSSETGTGPDNPSSTTVDDGSDTTDPSSSSSSSGDPSSSSTGEPEEPEAFAMVIQAHDAGDNRAFFRYRVEDEVGDGPTQTHPATGLDWDIAMPLPEGGMIYWERGYPIGAGDNMWLGTLDDPQPAELVQLDVRPVGTEAELSAPVEVPGAEAVVFVDLDAEVAYRVEIPDGVVSPPVAVASGVEEYPWPVADPTGTTLFFQTNLGDGNDVARASLASPDPDAVDILSDVPPGENAGIVGITPAGDGVFVWNNDANPELAFVELAGVQAPDPVPVVPALPPGYEGSYYHVAVDPARPAVIYASTDFNGDGAVRWIPIEDGTPQPAVTLMDGVTPSGGGLGWTGGGEWLVFQTFDGVAFELQLVHFDDDGPGEPIAFGPFDEIDDPYYALNVDPAHVYLHHELPGAGRELLRYPVEDGELGPVEVVLASDGDPTYSWPYFVQEGVLLVAMGSAAGEALYTVDISGAVAGAPERATPPLPAEQSIRAATFSPAGQYVVYSTDDDTFSTQRLLLVQRSSPDEEVEVMANVLGWKFVPNG